MPITVKARDGVTDLYGLMYKPTNLDEKKKYPIINRIYPGPQGGSVGSRSFSAARSDTRRWLNLDSSSWKSTAWETRWRSKKFHDAYYGNMGDNTLPDQITGDETTRLEYPGSISIASASGVIRVAVTQLPMRCFAIPISSKWESQSRETTTIASTKTTGGSDTRPAHPRQ